MNNIIRSGIIYTAMILCCSYCIAQNNILSDCDIEWRCLGPAHFGGRVTCVRGIPGDHKTFYVGTAVGGLFRTTNGGITFKSVFDATDSPSIGAIAVYAKDKNIIYVGTGEGDPRNDISYGDGIYRSDDGGETWKHLGLENSERFSSIIIHPDNPDIVYAAAMGRAWSEGEERGVFKTVDGGKTWEKILYTNNTSGSSSLSMHSGNPDVIYAGMYDYLRKPWHFRGGGEGSGLFKSEDGGKTWTCLTTKKGQNGLPGKKMLGRVDVDIAPSDPDVLYAMIESQEEGELWRSDDGGEKWKCVNSMGMINSRPFYYTTLFVSPDDPYDVWALSVVLFHSTNGGEKFDHNFGSIFGDHHAFWIDPEDTDHVIEGCDGGVSVSYDKGLNWDYINNIPMAQAYQVGYDMQIPYNLYSGFQDHEIWRGPSQRWAETGATGADWTRLRDMADGMYAAALPADDNIIIYSGHFGDITKLDIRNGEERFIQPYPIGPSGTSAAYEKYRFNWNSPVAFSPHDGNIIYYGGNVLFRSYDRGESWEVISPDLTTNDPEKMKLSGGEISLDNSRAEYHCTIISIAESPVQKGLIMAGTDDGNLQISRDNGKSWENMQKYLPGPDNGWISEIAPSAKYPERLYISIDQHRLGDFNTYLYRSDDLGRTWTEITDGLSSYVHCVKEDPENPSLLFAGTERGIFVSFNGGENWNSLNIGIPALPVRDIKIHPRDNDLIIATHGRGLYVLDDISWMREIAEIDHQKPYLFDVRHAYRYIPASDRSTQGNKIYIAPNPPYGALIDYYLPEKNANESVSIEARTTDGILLWKDDAENSAGVHRKAWNLSQDLSLSVKGITRDYLEGRVKTPPGNYKIMLCVNDNIVSEREFILLPDPRLTVTADETISCYETVKDLAVIMNYLRTCNTEMETMAALLKERTDIKNKNKIIEEIKILQATIIPPEMSPDGHNLLQRMNWLISQVGENSDAPTQAQRKWINILSEEAGNTLTQWKVLKDKIIREN